MAPVFGVSALDKRFLNEQNKIVCEVQNPYRWSPTLPLFFRINFKLAFQRQVDNTVVVISIIVISVYACNVLDELIY